jgi:hypothetical protein
MNTIPAVAISAEQHASLAAAASRDGVRRGDMHEPQLVREGARQLAGRLDHPLGCVGEVYGDDDVLHGGLQNFDPRPRRLACR